MEIPREIQGCDVWNKFKKCDRHPKPNGPQEPVMSSQEGGFYYAVGTDIMVKII